jgi:hypothetical protein
MEWRPINVYGANAYEVSNTGLIRNMLTKTERKPHIIEGYNYITLNGGKNKYVNVIVHRMVAMAFIENPEGKKRVTHIDKDKLNNNADNLRWW